MPVQISQPGRSTMRFIFQLALSACTTPGAAKEVQDASNYHEVLWEMNDKQNAAKEKPATPDESAVAKYGINSPQAQAARDARTTARKTAEAEKKKPNVKKKEAGKPPVTEEDKKE